MTPDAVEEAIAAVVGAGGGDSDDKVVLEALGIDLDRVREAAEKVFGPGALSAVYASRRPRLRLRLRRREPSCTKPTPHARFTPRAKRCLELALREALRLRHGYAGVEHIALGLVSRDDTVAWKVLLRLGIVPADLYRAIHESLRRRLGVAIPLSPKIGPRASPYARG